jgi:hypothetical protein
MSLSRCPPAGATPAYCHACLTRAASGDGQASAGREKNVIRLKAAKLCRFSRIDEFAKSKARIRKSLKM